MLITIMPDFSNMLLLGQNICDINRLEDFSKLVNLLCPLSPPKK